MKKTTHHHYHLQSGHYHLNWFFFGFTNLDSTYSDERKKREREGSKRMEKKEIESLSRIHLFFHQDKKQQVFTKKKIADKRK